MALTKITGEGVGAVDNLTVGDSHTIGDDANDNLQIKSSSGENIKYDSVGGTHLFLSNGSEKVRFQSGGGISFNGDTAAANALSDYEEGVHTATITTSISGSITLNSSFDKLSYTKIGRFVHVNGLIITSAVSSPNGYFTVSLPFVVGDLDGYAGRGSGSVTVHTSSANVRDFAVVSIEGENHFRVYLGDNTALQSDSANTLGVNNDIYVSFQYNTTA